ncbi:WecB/TagA/CpsF family glycosyltransferase [Candidatus Marithrix sp. Canyon 246]|uniref:WecB/TagA/CpsF family glycosyltransferase n=1 Tax=Candidatus Marithrix sp. Canyon 246 TaxID=1827136 RepID=UPI000849FAF6|nr:WecB/TagA/CpsF family glycosyltransferase [Candidatus Marithrix sp. Canyon 246]
MYILGMRVDATNYNKATNQVIQWIKNNESRYVCIANVHMTMEAYDKPEFQKIVNSADLVTPDGMPLVWTLRRLGIKIDDRVYGPTLMLHVCEAAEKHGIPIGLYGGSSETLEALKKNLKNKYTKIKIVYSYSPPFRSLTPEEDEQVVTNINALGVKILLVGLGCPKQEIWMNNHKDRLKVVMLGVGAAFDFHAGKIKQAPRWMQNIGIEWLFRLIMEPKRLWKRYLKHNPRFVVLIILQLIKTWKRKKH